MAEITFAARFPPIPADEHRRKHPLANAPVSSAARTGFTCLVTLSTSLVQSRAHTRVGGGVALEVGAVSGHLGNDRAVAGRDSVGAVAGAPDGSDAVATAGALVELLVSALGRSRVWRAVLVSVVLVLSAGSVLFGLAHRDAAPGVAMVLAVLGTVSLAGLRRWPVVAIGVVVAANGAFVVVSRLPWPPSAVFVWLVTLASAPLLVSRRRAVIVLLFTEVVVVVGGLMPSSVNARPWDAPITEALAALLVWAAASAARARRAADVQRAVVADELRLLHERDVAAQGRAGIARDLHDVVAHHVSLIAVRAATAAYQTEDVSPAAERVFDEIAAQARTALDELRSVLGVLRASDGEPQQAPQPGMADVSDLVDRMRAGGLHVAFRIVGTAQPVSDAAGLCCYRVMQEALTNVVRHEPGVAAQVDLHYGTDIAITISNPVTSARRHAQDGAGGFGLIGMRERVAATGGELQVAVAGGQFRVCARIPTGTKGAQG